MNEITQKPGLHCLIIIGAVACFAFFQFYYPYHLFYQEQNQLFLNSWEYMRTYLGKPGWLACLTGDFLTQFYHYRFMGPAIVTLCILASGYNVRRCVQTAGVKGTWIPYTASFVIMSLLVCFCFDYQYRLSSIIAFMGGANVFLASAKSLRISKGVIDDLDSLDKMNATDKNKKKETNKNKKESAKSNKDKMTMTRWISVFNVFITVLVCHWFFGSGIWMYVACILLACAVNYRPGTLYHILALALGLLVLTQGKRLYFIDYKTLYTYPSLGSFTLPQMDMEKSIAADCEYHLGDYNRIIAMVDNEKEPNKYMKFYYNLVTAQNRSLTESFQKFPDNNLGTLEPLDHTASPLTIHTLNELYWVLGDMTLCKRAALICNINSPSSRNIRMVKRLAEINLVTGDYKTARKYLRILQGTIVWRKWANRIFAALGSHATQEERLTLKPYLDKRPFVNTKDTLRLSDDCLTCMRELAESNPDNNIAINYLLCSDLQKQDLRTFKEDYDAYYLKQKHVLYDALYQEALAKYLSQENASPEEWRYYIKRDDIKKRYYHHNNKQ